ncbi:hypothetical protein KBD34_03695 [Patescibacteria group bacterium]|nr:hypothetical protein [Patescibacteria group bacterium]
MTFQKRTLLGLIICSLIGSAAGIALEAAGASIHWWGVTLFTSACWLLLCLFVYLKKRWEDVQAAEAKRNAPPADEFIPRGVRETRDPADIENLPVTDEGGRRHVPGATPVTVVVHPKGQPAAVAQFDRFAPASSDSGDAGNARFFFAQIVVQVLTRPGAPKDGSFQARFALGQTIPKGAPSRRYEPGHKVDLGIDVVDVFVCADYDSGRRLALKLNGVRVADEPTREATSAARFALGGGTPAAKPDAAAGN